MLFSHAIFSVWFLPIAFVAYLIVALYIVAPLRVIRKQAMDIQAGFEPIELPELPTDVCNAFYTASQWLAACGFTALGHLRKHRTASGQDSFVSVWVNHSSADSAQIIGIRTPWPTGGVRITTVLAFRTEFSDGTSIFTTNSKSGSVFPPDPRVNGIRCPGIPEVAKLYRVHRALVEQDRAGRTSTLDRVKDPLSRMNDEHRNTHERLIRAGYYRIDEASQRYVPTMKGAYLMTYRLLPPFKQIIRRRKNRKTARTLERLGFGRGGGDINLQSAQLAPLPVVQAAIEPEASPAERIPPKS
jgi:hypothetical protein